MDFRFTPEQEAFRAEVLRFIEAELPSDWSPVNFEDDSSDMTPRFQRALAARGWLAMAWPVEFGGLGSDVITHLIFQEEMLYHDAPSYNMGVAWVGPAIIEYGSDEQRARFLPRIASGEDIYCTLYSEPNAGSDLASLQTKAVESGDEFIVNGQKVWTSGAHQANWGWLAARTDPDAPKHRGISTFVVAMDTPGITVRPILNMTGQKGFNEVFFDNVRIPKENLIGELNRGWYHVAGALEYERSGIEWIATARRRFDEVLAFARENRGFWSHDPQLRFELAQRAIEIEAGRLLCYRVADLQAKGKPFTHEASVAKVYNSELTQRVAQTAMKIFGLYGNVGLGDKRAPLNGRLTHGLMNGYLWSVANTIGAGSSEIQRNIIATRGLGLPR